jgi:hypothetical protein
LQERGFLLIPHRVRGSAVVPAFVADVKSLPRKVDVLTNRRTNSRLQISTDAHADMEVVDGAADPALVYRA